MWKIELPLTEVGMAAERMVRGQEGECRSLDLDLLCGRILLEWTKKYIKPKA